MQRFLLFLITCGLIKISFSQTQAVRDLEGNTYKTVQIGNQVWMAENLRVKRFKNGDAIPNLISLDDWMSTRSTKKPGFCYYENNSEANLKYGPLYNWYAVSDPRGLAPEGWRVPTQKDWDDLHAYIDSVFYTYLNWARFDKIVSEINLDKYGTMTNDIASLGSILTGFSKDVGPVVKFNDSLAKKKIPEVLGYYYKNPNDPLYAMLHRLGCGAYLKSNVASEWITITEQSRIDGGMLEFSGAGNNFSRFSGLPGGVREEYDFAFKKEAGYFWSSSLDGFGVPVYLILYADKYQGFWNMSGSKSAGMSVRCIKIN